MAISTHLHKNGHFGYCVFLTGQITKNIAEGKQFRQINLSNIAHVSFLCLKSQKSFCSIKMEYSNFCNKSKIFGQKLFWVKPIRPIPEITRFDQSCPFCQLDPKIGTILKSFFVVLPGIAFVISGRIFFSGAPIKQWVYRILF